MSSTKHTKATKYQNALGILCTVAYKSVANNVHFQNYCIKLIYKLVWLNIFGLRVFFFNIFVYAYF